MSAMLRNTAFAIATFALTVVPGTALGQAWVGVKGGLSLSMDYTYSPSDRIVETEGEVFEGPGTGSTNHTVAISTEYTPIENLAITAMIPIVTTKYHTSPDAVFAGHGSFDDGNHHTVLQDFKLTTRYMILNNSPIAFSPHVGISFPMSNYENLGYASAGRGLKQLHVGAGIGKYFTSGPVKNLYLHLLYEFSIVERYKTVFPETDDYGQNRSDVKFIAGYFVNDNIEINLGADYAKTHGGLDFLDYNDLPEWVQIHHDPILAESFLLVGGGVTYEPFEGFRFNFALRYWATGTNTRDGHIASIGFAWDII